MPANTYKRFLGCGDNHGELVCKDAMRVLLKFAEDWKPHYRIHLGDVWDFAALRGGASPEDKAQGIAEDYREGLRFLQAFKPNYLTLGNHDDRIWMATEKRGDGIIRETCEKLARESESTFKKMGIKWVTYHVNRYLRMPEGGPRLIHGFRSTMYPAKAHFENWGECIHGHTHKPDEYTARHADGSQSFSVGCMADIDKLTYADRTPAKLAWRNGFLYGYINTKTGKWNAWNVKKENGDWLSPQGVL